MAKPAPPHAKLITKISALASGEQKPALLADLKSMLKKGESIFAAKLKANPTDGLSMIVARCAEIDMIIKTAFDVLTKAVHPQEGEEQIAILAVGGFGRGELAPHSDIDLMTLMPSKVTPRMRAIVEDMYYLLWDLGLDVGHSSRNVDDCLKIGREDMSVRSALLEHRYLTGNASLAQELRTHLQSKIFADTGSEFIEAKLAERSARHEKHGGQRYMLEPNIKEGKGGLRDLQSMFWIAKYVHNVENSEDLVGLGVFRAEEFAAFARAHSFLWAVRIHLHRITGRATNQLNFDLQVELATLMGYCDHDGRLGVEHFMQAYFLHATRVGELTRIFLTALEVAHVKKPPSLTRYFKRKKPVSEAFYVRQNRLTYADEDVFDREPLNILRIFEEALQTGYLLHPDAVRLIPLRRNLIDDAFRKNPQAHEIFFRLLLDHGDPARGLRRMNECGVLASFLPDFRPVVAMMQFNSYHAYTVDEHIFQCISTLAEIENGLLTEALPYSSKILNTGLDRKVLYLALLLHDIGKGREEDHSLLGARIARRVARDLGLSEEQVETVEWLVKNHLLMSDMAQKRDVSDPRTVDNFAKVVKSKKRLDLLLVLTSCDIRGVGPGVLNNWKSQLLRDLYHLTSHALEAGVEATNQPMRIEDAKAHLRTALADWSAQRIEAEIARHYAPYWKALPNESHIVFAHLLDGITDKAMRFELKPDEARDATHAYFAGRDQRGIFSRICGALALVGANVIDARTYTTQDGYVTAAFWVQDQRGQPYALEGFKIIAKKIAARLKGKRIARDALLGKDKIKARERRFVIPTSIAFNNEDSAIYTIIEINTRDRLGLLYDLARTLADANIQIASTIIATYGAEAVDSFYVKDAFGLKYTSKSKQKSLEKRLQKAVETGVERAIA